MLTREELPYPNLFGRLDRDGNNLISREESQQLRARNEDRGDDGDGTTPESTEGGGDQPELGKSPAGLARDVLAELDAAMGAAVEDREVAGVVGLLHRGGTRGYFEAFGWQDLEGEREMPRDAIFRLQSMSKPVVTVAALVLHEAGEFDLDEPIAKHLPEWAEPKVLVEGELVPAHTAITPRMLMSHSSGLYYGTLPGYPKPRSRPTDLEANSKLLATFPLKFHPGAGYSYGTSIDVLGRYCEVVAGKPLDEVFRERVLAPLHMDETDFWVPEDKADRIAQVYTQSSPGELKRGREASRLTRKPTLFLGGQGLCSTAEDYEKFCLMLLNGGTLNGVRVLSEKTVDDIFTNQLADIGERYGLGGSVDGDGGYAWGGANGTQFWIDRPNNMIGIFMVQTQRYRAPTFNRFRSLAWEAITDEPQPDTTDGPVGKAVDPALRWTRSLQLPLIDDGGHRLTGTEVMELAAFRGALYAGNSQWNAKNDHRPTQVFTLKGLDQSWQLDFELPEVYTRTTYLQTFTFRTDGNGDAIEPRSVLLLGVNRQRVRGAKTPAVVFVKDDQTDAWVEHTIGLSDTEKWAVGVRSMGFHRDKVTGADKVFLGIGPGAGVYSGTWDARDGGSIRWSREPEFKPAAQQRVIGFTVCDDVLYAATQRILYRRHTDGPEPRWETVLEKRASSEFVQNYRDDLHPGWVKYDHFRALGASEYKEGSGEFLLFGSLNRIFRLNPKSDVIEPEINIKKLFKDQLGMDIHYAQAQHYQPVVLADQDQMAIIGLEVMFEDDYIAAHPEVPTSHVLDRHADKKVHWAKQGFYLERRQAVDGTPSYTIREIHDPTHQPQPEWLARVRSVQTSPFPGDTERVIYASGFAPWGLDLRVNDTGWVYRGELQPSAADN